MVRLNRIYTRSGDDGSTALGDGSRVPKTHPRIEAYGTVDELNAVVGLCRGDADATLDAECLGPVQHDLFDVGADLCVPPREGERRLRVAEERVAWVEGWIDRTNEGLPELTSFVLPAGTPAAARLHLARTVARRAERRVLALAAAEEVNPVCARYLNRLSDLLFVLARRAAGDAEVLWEPGRGA